jgi:hypothetical protein
MLIKFPPGTEEYIHMPGASKSKADELLEKEDTTSATVAIPFAELPSPTDPTLTARDTQAGWLMLPALPSLPEATTVAIPLK